MKLEAIHIVSLDVPFPPDYGGMFDIYYKCRTFKELGIRVILHCFEYGRGTGHDFTGIADEVYYYPRKKSVAALFSTTPFIVATRRSKALTERLLADNLPILIEGDHCAGLLQDRRFDKRLRILRVHNIEWKYYAALAGATSSWLKKIFFLTESSKLRSFESTCLRADLLLCVSKTELVYYQQRHENAHFWEVNVDFNRLPENQPETGDFALFQGNLSVSENQQAIRWILQQWKEQQIDMPLVIAGKNPGSAFQAEMDAHPFVKTVISPNMAEMDRLIRTAAVNLLITFQATGIKLKLIHALFQGNRCIVNPEMVEGTSLAPYCEIVKDGKELSKALKTTVAASIPNRQERLDFLKRHFDNVANAREVIALIEEKM